MIYNTAKETLQTNKSFYAKSGIQLLLSEHFDVVAEYEPRNFPFPFLLCIDRKFRFFLSG